MKLNSKITKIVKIDKGSFAVTLVFDDNTKATVSLSHIFQNPKVQAREILRGDLFDKCFIESGALAWPNGLELCADSIKIRIAECEDVA